MFHRLGPRVITYFRETIKANEADKIILGGTLCRVVRFASKFSFSPCFLAPNHPSLTVGAFCRGNTVLVSLNVCPLCSLSAGRYARKREVAEWPFIFISPCFSLLVAAVSPYIYLIVPPFLSLSTTPRSQTTGLFSYTDNRFTAAACSALYASIIRPVSFPAPSCPRNN